MEVQIRKASDAEKGFSNKKNEFYIVENGHCDHIGHITKIPNTKHDTHPWKVFKVIWPAPNKKVDMVATFYDDADAQKIGPVFFTDPENKIGGRKAAFQFVRETFGK